MEILGKSVTIETGAEIASCGIGTLVVTLTITDITLVQISAGSSIEGEVGRSSLADTQATIMGLGTVQVGGWAVKCAGDEFVARSTAAVMSTEAVLAKVTAAAIVRGTFIRICPLCSSCTSSSNSTGQTSVTLSTGSTIRTSCTSLASCTGQASVTLTSSSACETTITFVTLCTSSTGCTS